MLPMRRSKIEVDPDDEALTALVRHLHVVLGLPMRQIVAELEAMGLVDPRGQPLPLSLVWTILRSRSAQADNDMADPRICGR
jgi:hypothetical protein